MKLSFLGSLFFLATLVSADDSGQDSASDHSQGNGTKCLNPSIRKEWRSLTDDEKADFISSIKCLAHMPHDPKLSPTVKPDDIPPVNDTSSYWDDISYIHMDMNFKIHFTGLFLPWHRWFVHVVETELRKKCGFSGTMPYWDWTRDAADFQGATIFAEPDLNSGLGGWGQPEDDYLVHDGGFSYDFELAYPVPHGLRRNYTLRPWESNQFAGMDVILDPSQMANVSFTADKIQQLVNGNEGNYVGFQFSFEDWEAAHASVHEMTGGDMAGNCPATAPSTCAPGPLWSPNDPLFFLHHTTVDKVWYDWQNKSPVNKNAYAGGSVQLVQNRTMYLENPNGGPPFLTPQSVVTGEGMFDDWVIEDYLSTTDGPLCYVYAE
ncbi:Di-copper centre-containing protein [Guyanagaster necrorhizus]|uniref:Di-copper centre-containing protein n=1 Tax=Guyanagaster necrorhizus TaxID=856835 RepID=A0A9P8AZ72_9AGAR|nr:Di-copper centre-containing protein [Guyanagaster necrorhizus MCA 3950]KAG7451672.1 Di-copper centre-containing protein [Guyanagaster necrorhizus MCA 3950]